MRRVLRLCLGSVLLVLMTLAGTGPVAADHCGATGEIRPAVGPPTTVFVFSAYLGSPADLFLYRNGDLVDTLALAGDDEQRALIRTNWDDGGSWRAEAVVRGNAACRAVASFEVVPGATADVWVGITGPRDWQPSFDYVLEIDGRAWVFPSDNPGGLVTHALTVPTIIRLRRLSDCTPVVRFVAPPSGHYTIRFSADEVPRVEDWTLLGMDTPGGPDSQAPSCPALPDTSTAPPDRSREIVLVFLIAAGFGFVGVVRRVRSRWVP